MATKSISKRTKIKYSEDVSYVECIPRPIITVALNYPSNHRIPAHIHQSDQFLYTSAGVMTARVRLYICLKEHWARFPDNILSKILITILKSYI